MNVGPHASDIPLSTHPDLTIHKGNIFSFGSEYNTDVLLQTNIYLINLINFIC